MSTQTTGGLPHRVRLLLIAVALSVLSLESVIGCSHDEVGKSQQCS